MSLQEYTTEMHALREQDFFIEPMTGHPTTDELLQLRPFIERWLTEAAQVYSLWDVFRAIDRQEITVLRIWCNLELQAACFLQHTEYAGERALHVTGIAGAMLDNWLEVLLTELDQLAADCKYITLAGRPGWRKKLRDHRYKHVFSLMAKKMEP